jgi:hypothetical protein
MTMHASIESSIVFRGERSRRKNNRPDILSGMLYGLTQKLAFRRDILHHRSACAICGRRRAQKSLPPGFVVQEIALMLDNLCLDNVSAPAELSSPDMWRSDRAIPKHLIVRMENLLYGWFVARDRSVAPFRRDTHRPCPTPQLVPLNIGSRTR